MQPQASKLPHCLDQVKTELSEAQRNASEALQEAESRHEQIVAELREAADEAGLAADSTTQAAEQWRRRSASLFSVALLRQPRLLLCTCCVLFLDAGLWQIGPACVWRCC